MSTTTAVYRVQDVLEIVQEYEAYFSSMLNVYAVSRVLLSLYRHGDFKRKEKRG